VNIERFRIALHAAVKQTRAFLNARTTSGHEYSLNSKSDVEAIQRRIAKEDPKDYKVKYMFGDDKVEKKDALCNFVLPPEVLTYSQVIALSSEKMMDLKICDILLCETTSNSTIPPQLYNLLGARAGLEKGLRHMGCKVDIYGSLENPVPYHIFAEVFRPLVLIDHETALNDGDMATLQAQVANGVLARTGPRRSGSSSNLVESVSEAESASLVKFRSIVENCLSAEQSAADNSFLKKRLYKKVHKTKTRMH
jgi:hypothetical protein